MSHHQGVFCISIDGHPGESPSAHLAERRQDMAQLLQRFELASNWSVSNAPRNPMSADREVTLSVPSRLPRVELIQLLRQTNASLSREGQHVRSVILDPHEVKTAWDVLVRYGCEVVRPRTMDATTDSTTRILRGGLWVVPMTCSFVGGSRRSVRQLFSVCQRYLVASAQNRRVFHLHVDLTTDRKSWKEEQQALEALFQTASDLRKKSRLHCDPLSAIPQRMSRKAAAPMTSVLRRVA